MTWAQKYKPAVSKRNLLFIAGSIWGLAGLMLISRGLLVLVPLHHFLLPELLIGVGLGACLFVFLFTKILKKHITRISLIEADYPCFFSFFNFKSYILMAGMIASGIALRELDFVEPEIVYTFYIAMGIPLVLSAVRFLMAGIKNTIRV